MIPPTARAEALVDAALDQATDAMIDDDLERAETAMSTAMRAAWLVKQRERLALLDLDESPS
jgi:hypothetical protein